MALLDLVRLLIRHARILVMVPLGIGLTVLVLTHDRPPEYEAHATLYTGLVSGYEADNQGGRKSRGVESAFDNLIGTINARSTLKTVALRLIAQHVSALNASTKSLRDATREKLRGALPDTMRSRLADMTVSDAQHHLRAALGQHAGLRKTIFSSSTPFSVPGIQDNLHVYRFGESDLLKMDYTTIDPVLSKQTLDILIEEVTMRRRQRSQRQVRDVVDFFERAVDSARKELNDQVAKLRNFGVENEIINYEQQTKTIAAARQEVAHDLRKARTRLKASQSARADLEERMDANMLILRSNDDLLRLRRKLADVSAQKALQETESGSEGGALQERIDTLRRRLSEKVRHLYRLNHSPNGVANDRLLDRWLQEVLATTEAEAQVKVLERRLNAFKRRYRELAPLGSDLAGIRREVDIAENQYLELLRSLNQARIKEKMERQSALQVVDSPIVPNEPTPSNRLFLVVGSAAAGGVLVLACILAFFLLDSTLRTPRRAEQQIGLELAGAYPVHPETSGEAEARTLDHVEPILDAQLLRAVQANRPGLGRTDAAPDVLLVNSTRRREGKTYVAERLCRELTREEYRVQLLSPDAGSGRNDFISDVGTTHYDPDRPTVQFVEQVETAREEVEQDVIVVEIPALVERGLPVGLAQHVSGVLLVVRADRRWTRSDDHALQGLQSSLDLAPLLVVNGTSLDALEALVGEVPHEGSTIRRTLTRWCRLEFRSPLSFSS